VVGDEGRHLKAETKFREMSALNRALKAGNVSSSIKEQNKLVSWCKPKNSKSRCRRLSAGDAGVKLSNRFSVLETHTLDIG
jgi:hypothetical protein